MGIMLKGIINIFKKLVKTNFQEKNRFFIWIFKFSDRLKLYKLDDYFTCKLIIQNLNI